MKGGRRGWATKGRRLPLRHPGLPLQIWHITLKRPQAYVRIGNENALKERRKTEEENETERLTSSLKLGLILTHNDFLIGTNPMTETKTLTSMVFQLVPTSSQLH